MGAAERSGSAWAASDVLLQHMFVRAFTYDLYRLCPRTISARHRLPAAANCALPAAASCAAPCPARPVTRMHQCLGDFMIDAALGIESFQPSFDLIRAHAAAHKTCARCRLCRAGPPALTCWSCRSTPTRF